MCAWSLKPQAWDRSAQANPAVRDGKNFLEAGDAGILLRADSKDGVEPARQVSLAYTQIRSQQADREDMAVSEAFRGAGNERIGISFAQVRAQKICHEGNTLNTSSGSRDLFLQHVYCAGFQHITQADLALCKSPDSGLSRTTTTPVGPKGRTVTTPDRRCAAT